MWHELKFSSETLERLKKKMQRLQDEGKRLLDKSELFELFEQDEQKQKGDGSRWLPTAAEVWLHQRWLRTGRPRWQACDAQKLVKVLYFPFSEASPERN
jgi:hypothetical protein